MNTPSDRVGRVIWSVTLALAATFLGGCTQATAPSQGDPDVPGPGTGTPPTDPVPVETTQEVVIDFDGATPDYVAQGFTGLGLAAEPGAGMLDADNWQITGFSDGDLTFGSEATAGDYARGKSPGGVSTGGLYAFETAPGNVALGVQATASDFAPGSVELRLPVTVTTATAVDISFALAVRNDEGRSSSWSCSLSIDGETWNTLPGMTVTTPADADPAPEWIEERRSLTVVLSEVNVVAGSTLYVRWDAEDAGGTGGRDEVALDDINVTVTGRD